MIVPDVGRRPPPERRPHSPVAERAANVPGVGRCAAWIASPIAAPQRPGAGRAVAVPAVWTARSVARVAMAASPRAGCRVRCGCTRRGTARGVARVIQRGTVRVAAFVARAAQRTRARRVEWDGTQHSSHHQYGAPAGRVASARRRPGVEQCAAWFA